MFPPGWALMPFLSFESPLGLVVSPSPAIVSRAAGR
jgi:hypothetical protein